MSGDTERIHKEAERLRHAVSRIENRIELDLRPSEVEAARAEVRRVYEEIYGVFCNGAPDLDDRIVNACVPVALQHGMNTGSFGPVMKAILRETDSIGVARFGTFVGCEGRLPVNLTLSVDVSQPQVGADLATLMRRLGWMWHDRDTVDWFALHPWHPDPQVRRGIDLERHDAIHDRWERHEHHGGDCYRFTSNRNAPWGSPLQWLHAVRADLGL